MKHRSHKKTLFIVAACSFFFLGTLLVWASTVRLPDISTFEARKIANSSKITDRTGTVVLYDIHQSVRRTEIPISEMGETIQNAIISIEDAHFYEHKGIRPTSILRAAYTAITHQGFIQGGSTITQQIVKNTLLNTDKTIARKVKEWVLALKIERQFSKSQILQIYLNDAPFGGTIYGVEEASKAFFTIPAKELSIAQAAYLAAMLPAPSYYSPFGQHKDKLAERKNLVLKKMYGYGKITEAQYKKALTEKVTFNPSASNSIKAPHFVFYILDQLQKKYGQNVMETGGYTIKTTLDYDLQQKAEKIISEGALQNEKKYNASNAALFAIDPTNGQILSMVGSRNYFDTAIDGAYNVVTADRQPGSSFKPFVYLTAFAKGYTPETILFDVPTEFSTKCTSSSTPLPGYTSEDCYNPDNFDNKFKGPISLRDSLAESRNVPSVKLLYLVGVNNAVNTSHQLGVTTLTDPKEIGLSLVLGGGEVKLFDMVGAYATFANNGVKNPITGILEVRDANGTIVDQYQPNPIIAFDKNAVTQLNDVLSDAKARIPTFGDLITIPGVAVKTGTTNNDKDAWIIGYTPSIAVGVWSGNNDNKSMKSGGSAVSGPLWKNFMQQALLTYPAKPFEKPIPDPNYSSLKPILRGIWQGNTTVLIDKVTGLRATENTPIEARIEKAITDVKDILYWVNKQDPAGPIPKNPYSDPQFELWNTPVQNWWRDNMSKYGVTTQADIPTNYETIHNPAAISPITIKGVDTPLNASKANKITITSEGQYPLKSADIYINGNYVITTPSSMTFLFTPKDYGYMTGTYTLKAVATNSIYSKIVAEKQIIIE